jgi:hypothetical protein
MTLVVVASPTSILQFFSDDGTFLVGGQLYTTVGGVPYPTYADAQGLIQHANPIILNSRGEIATSSGQSAQLYLVPDVTYTFALFDAQSNPIYTPTNIEGVPSSVTITNLINQQFIGTVLYPPTVAEIAVGVIPTGPYDESDIRRYGASVLASDNSIALNTAALVSSAGGNAVFIPPGTWAFTSAFVLAGQSSVYGTGASSILSPAGCDGVQLGNSGGIGVSRFMRDLQILGTATSANNGISCNFTSASGQRVSGMEFINVSIRNFGQAVFARGLWQSTFQDCFLFNNYQGYYFHGENIVVHIIGGFVQNQGSTGVTGSGIQYAVLSDLADGVENTESIHLDNVGLYNYGVAVSLQLVLYATITNCDISAHTTTGIQISTCRGGIDIIGNWIQSGGTAPTTGVQLTSVGTPINDKVVIDSNTIVFIPNNTLSLGVDVGAGNIGVSILNNTIGSDFASSQPGIGIANRPGAHNMIAQNNSIAALTGPISAGSLSTDMTIGPNVSGALPPIVFDAATPAGFAFFGRGTFTGALTGYASPPTGTVSWFANGHEITLTIPAAGISGTSNATTLTMTGLPQWLWPVTDQTAMANVVDSGTGSYGTAVIAAATGVITFKKDANGSAFTASGTKAVNGTTIKYAYA